MAPLYRSGQYLLCRKARKTPRVGDIVVADTKAYGRLLKRVCQVDEATRTVRLKGLNLQSVTSDEIGAVPFDRLRWRVIFPRRGAGGAS